MTLALPRRRLGYAPSSAGQVAGSSGSVSITLHGFGGTLGHQFLRDGLFDAEEAVARESMNVHAFSADASTSTGTSRSRRAGPAQVVLPPADLPDRDE
ncbi:hypothetical protein [Actinoplanes sp. GCM10030250]|uniref:hypothetical protein n=1 Tax=Actinoplanes sp. GCM10030250 TaxID=3273376 RepID=UPI00361245C9